MSELFTPEIARTKEEVEAALQYGRLQRYLADKRGRNFSEFILKDGHGSMVWNHDTHALMQDFIDDCRKLKKWPLIEAAMGLGKTEQVAISRVIQMIIENPEVKIAVVSESYDQAKKRVMAVSKYLHTIAADFGITIVRDNANELLVARKSPSKDPTLSGYGIDSASTGGRFDVLILDDIETIDNTVINDLSDKVYQSVNLKWLTRLVPGGMVIVINTKYIKDGPIDRLENDRRFAVLRIALNDDLATFTSQKWIDRIPVERSSLPAWSSYKTEAELQNMRDDPRTYRLFKLAYQLDVEETTSQTFKSIFKCQIDQVKTTDLMNDAIQKNQAVYVNSVDLSGMNRKGTVILNSMLIRDDKKIVKTVHYSAKYLKVNWLELRDEIIAQNDKQPAVWIIEGNAMQSNLVPLIQEKAREMKKPVQIIVHMTGRNKRDLEVGVENLNTYFDKELILFNISDQGVQLIVDEFKLYGMKADTFDGVMAAWFINVNAPRFAKKVDSNIEQTGTRGVLYNDHNQKNRREYLNA